MDKKNTVTIRLTDEQFGWLRALSRRSKRSQSEVVRSLIEHGTVRERITRENLDIIRKLIGESTNLNQLAKRANAYGFYRVADECRVVAQEISQLIKQLKDDSKIVKGTSFSGCVNYVLKEDKSRLLKAVGVYGSPEEIAEQFELQTLLNDKVKNTVGHISLSFSAEDGDRIRDDDGLMLKIAHDYMKLMGIENTQFIIARHTDRDHPHCHIVYNRVANDGRTISDKNDRYRNEKVCKMLTARYRLHFAEGKEHVNFMRLRHHDRVKYFIYHALKREVSNARSWSELRLALRKYGIDTQWKQSRTTGEMQGVKFTCNQLTFSGSKIDRQFSFLNIDQELRYNALSATVSLRQAQAETIREELRHEYQQENHSGISLGLFTPSPTDYDTEEAIQANRLKKKKKKPKRKRGFSL